MKLNIAALLMLASFVLLYTVAVEAQGSVPVRLDALSSHYARTVFELRNLGTCSTPCQDISPLHCQEDIPTFTVFSPSSGEQLCDSHTH